MIDHQKTIALNELYAMINERIYLIRATFDNDEAFFDILNGLKDDRKIAVEIIAFLHAEDIQASTVRAFLDAHDIVKAGNRLIYDGDMQYGYRKAAVQALSALVCEVYKHLSKEKFDEVIRTQFSHKAIQRIQEAWL